MVPVPGVQATILRCVKPVGSALVTVGGDECVGVKLSVSAAVLGSPALAWLGQTPPKQVTYMESKTLAIFSWGINTHVRHPVSTLRGCTPLIALLNQQQYTLSTHKHVYACY